MEDDVSADGMQKEQNIDFIVGLNDGEILGGGGAQSKKKKQKKKKRKNQNLA